MTTYNPDRVRPAEPSDEEALVQLCAALHAENGRFGVDFAKVRAALREAISGPFNRRNGVIGIIDGPDGYPAGAIYLRITNEWYSADGYLHEVFNFVYPEYRSGTTNSHDLIAWSQRVSDAFGDVQGPMPLIIGILSDERTEAKKRHYQRQLGSPIGHYFGYGFKKEVV